MSVNDITLFRNPYSQSSGSIRYAVAASATIIYPGEPVAQALGGYVVTQMATNKPVIKTDFLAGIATSQSTNTAAAAGTVDVMPILPGMVFLISPNVAATWDTQAEYDLLVGDRVLLDLTSGVFTILAADGSTYGCLIMPLDITKYPGKVAFSFFQTVMINQWQD